MQYISAIVGSILFVLLTIADNGTFAISGNNEIRVGVCAAGALSDIQLIATRADNSTVHISGSVKQASRIDIFVDGQRKAQIMVSGVQSNYFTTVQMTNGEHLVEAYVYDTCTDQALVSRTNITISDTSRGGVAKTPEKLLQSPVSFTVDPQPPVYYMSQAQNKPKTIIDDIIRPLFIDYTLLFIGFCLALWSLLRTFRWRLYETLKSRSATKRRQHIRRQQVTVFIVIGAIICIITGLLLVI
jgi:hypothetical protein